LIIRSANCLLLSLSDFVSASLLDAISSISLCAASVTKSWVFGAIPMAVLTPVFSGNDCANAGASTARKTAPVASSNLFMRSSC
jgi:hypothetical protein